MKSEIEMIFLKKYFDGIKLYVYLHRVSETDTPKAPIRGDSLSFGTIAQLVEQRTENPCVPGSIPGGTTSLKLKALLF